MKSIKRGQFVGDLYQFDVFVNIHGKNPLVWRFEDEIKESEYQGQ